MNVLSLSYWEVHSFTFHNVNWYRHISRKSWCLFYRMNIKYVSVLHAARCILYTVRATVVVNTKYVLPYQIRGIANNISMRVHHIFLLFTSFFRNDGNVRFWLIPAAIWCVHTPTTTKTYHQREACVTFLAHFICNFLEEFFAITLSEVSLSYHIIHYHVHIQQQMRKH